MERLKKRNTHKHTRCDQHSLPVHHCTLFLCKLCLHTETRHQHRQDCLNCKATHHCGNVPGNAVSRRLDIFKVSPVDSTHFGSIAARPLCGPSQFRTETRQQRRQDCFDGKVTRHALLTPIPNGSWATRPRASNWPLSHPSHRSPVGTPEPIRLPKKSYLTTLAHAITNFDCQPDSTWLRGFTRLMGHTSWR